jgi:hypothetical protein
VGAGCTSANQLCVRSAGASFETALCISQVGDVSCPAQDYTERTLMFTSVADTRGCADCTCGDPTGITCGGTVTLYTNNPCSGNGTGVPTTGTCVAAPGLEYFHAGTYAVTTGPTGGSCDPAGGAATGEATPGDPVTICCLP